MIAKIIVISLPESKRRVLVEEELNQYGLDFEYLDAVNGKTGTHEFLKKCDKKKFRRNMGRDVLPGEIGCYASHELAWLKCIEWNQPVIILEDDFVCEPGVVEYLKLATKYAEQGCNYIRLEPNEQGDKAFEIIERHKKYNYVRYMIGSVRMTAYLITPVAASCLVEHSKVYQYPVDFFPYYLGIARIKTYGFDPALIRTRDECSHIGMGRTRSKSNHLIRWTSSLFKRKMRLKTWWCELRSQWRC